MNKVYRCFTEKLPGFDTAAHALCAQLRSERGIKSLTDVRILSRYDVQGIDDDTYKAAKQGVFSEPACDAVYDEVFTVPEGYTALYVQSLPGQFDMRADSCEQCIAMLTGGERPIVEAATLYLLGGDISGSEFEQIKTELINPVECRQASEHRPDSLERDYPVPPDVAILTGFTKEGADMEAYLADYSLAMDAHDLRFLRDYFVTEGRDPSITELRMIDTYWSDHCRHTTFATEIQNADLQDEAVKQSYERYLNLRREYYGDRAQTRPITLMDIATLGAKVLKSRGVLRDLDESEEINACSVKIEADIDGKKQPWLLMFKNETHNHPTEIEPFGGAATCLGGAIRDPLSGRSYVYQAMRVTGAADPRTDIADTMPGKLPQRTICRRAAAGYSSYGNQIGLATGLVSEVYHPGYVAKRLETGAVIAAAPAENVRRERPEAGDIIVLLGGKTGRDGCGGATGSSKSHSEDSLAECGAEVQKGNAPEERKIQRLMRNGQAAKLIKRCNDFGAGGVSVAVGELADGLLIDLDAVPKKYNGLDGTELAISESQERMAVVLSPQDVEQFCKLAEGENLQASVIATVTDKNRLQMTWRGKMICDISRDFLNTNGAKKAADVQVPDAPHPETELFPELSGQQRAQAVLTDLNVAMQKGLGTRFDGSVGAASVTMPYGGAHQMTPTQAMAAKLPVLRGETTTASLMAYGFDPMYMAQNPYVGAQASLISSVARIVASGGDPARVWLSLQEFFEKPDSARPQRLGKPFSALLGALDAQIDLGAGAIGGKDSMSGTFKDIDVPPTLISFAVTTLDAQNVLTPEFKGAGNGVYLLTHGGTASDARKLFDEVHKLCKQQKILSAWALSAGGATEAVCKMALGNAVGFTCDSSATEDDFYTLCYGGFAVETAQELEIGKKIGTTGGDCITLPNAVSMSIEQASELLCGTLESTYPSVLHAQGEHPIISDTRRNTARPSLKIARPLAVIPAFPGTNCEEDTRRAVERAGGHAEIVLVRNMSPEALGQSIKQLKNAIDRAQMLIIPGGFSGGDEPDGSGKFIQALLRAPQLKDAVMSMLNQRDGLALGICNGFQALIKLGLVPFGEICELDSTCPTLTYNTIGRHQSIYAHTRVASTMSPWLSRCEVGQVHNIAFSHGEGRFMADAQTLERLRANGQIAMQYCTADGQVLGDGNVNINGSAWGIEAISSPDGRVLGKMGHTERAGESIARNIAGNKYQPLFEAGVEYFML